MAQCIAKSVRVIQLTLSEEEAAWLSCYLQNDVHFDPLELQDPREEGLRKEIRDKLTTAFQN